MSKTENATNTYLAALDLADLMAYRKVEQFAAALTLDEVRDAESAALTTAARFAARGEYKDAAYLAYTGHGAAAAAMIDWNDRLDCTNTTWRERKAAGQHA